ncbi:hypothetical protein A0H81_09365 [Grifola frondosa]|uniref:Peptidase A1 domain-containing protein n=1 Tax=Grifola frondosa TaxID=5627 RepID=A0A1C7M321_GRIFR|nr:hypothetical protein A0H81_09365 [Grifola frondosa]
MRTASASSRDITTLCSQAFSLSGVSAPLKRDLAEFADDITYTNAMQNALFLQVWIADTSAVVQLDTTATDLLVTGLLPNSGLTNTGKTTSDVVKDVTVTGSIFTGDVMVDGLEVSNMSLTYANSLPNSIVNLNESAIYGRLGLALPTATGSALALLLQQAPSDHQYYTILFSPDVNKTGTDGTFSGFFTIGELVDLSEIFNGASADLPDLTLIKGQPELPLTATGQFSVDAISINAQPFQLKSEIPQAPSGKPLAIVNTADPWIRASFEVVSAIYGNVSGATFVDQSTIGTFQVPCSTQVEVTVTLGGQDYVLDPSTLVRDNPFGDACAGVFATNGQAVSAIPAFDLSFGPHFLKNVNYSSSGSTGDNTAGARPSNIATQATGSAGNAAGKGYGSTPTGGSTGTTQGSSSWLSRTPQRSTSTTTVTVTHTNVGTTTVAGPPPSSAGTGSSSSSSSSWTGTGAAATASPGVLAGNLEGSNGSSDNSNNLNLPSGSIADKLKHCLPAIIVLAIVVGVLLIGGLVFCLVRRRSPGSGARPSAYRSLHAAETAEPTHVPLYGAEEGSSRYSDPYRDDK